MMVILFCPIVLYEDVKRISHDFLGYLDADNCENYLQKGTETN